MLKRIFFSFSLLVAVSTYGQELTAVQKVPSSATPGTEIPVEITINKGGMTGFMKFFQELPEGFSGTGIESKSGSFSSTDGGVKIVWIAPPTDPSFTISYKIAIPASFSGPLSLGGKISYILENERKTFDIPVAIVNTGSSASAVKTEAPKPNPAPVTTPKPTPAPPVAQTQPVEVTKPAPVPVEKPAPQPTPKPVTMVKQNSPVPTAAAADNSGKTYKVQIGAFAQKPNLTGVPEMSTFVLENGITKYFSGNFSNYADAAKRRAEMLNQGFMGAFIVAFENGKIVR